MARLPGEPADLGARIEAQLRERIEEAVDFVCLDVLVAQRRAAGRPAPVADSASDRAEYQAGACAFLTHLAEAIAPALTPAQRERVQAAGGAAAPDEAARLLVVQVALARALPDYWQRFEACRLAFGAVGGAGASGARSPRPESGGKRRGLLRRLFRRG